MSDKYPLPPSWPRGRPEFTNPMEAHSPTKNMADAPTPDHVSVLLHPPGLKRVEPPKPSVKPRPVVKVSFDLSQEQKAPEIESSESADTTPVDRGNARPFDALATLTQPLVTDSLANALLDPSPKTPVAQEPRHRSHSFSTSTDTLTQFILPLKSNKQQAQDPGKVRPSVVHSLAPFEQLALCLPPPSRGPLAIVPQMILNHIGSSDSPGNAVRLPTVTFQSKKGNAELGVGVGEVLADRLSCAPADLIGASDTVFAKNVEVVDVRIAWPGYEITHTSTIDTQHGNVTRGYVLMIISRALMEFAENVRDVSIAPGMECWKLGNRGIRARDLIITSLHHKGGKDWQPVIFALPRI